MTSIAQILSSNRHFTPVASCNSDLSFLECFHKNIGLQYIVFRYPNNKYRFIIHPPYESLEDNINLPYLLKSMFNVSYTFPIVIRDMSFSCT